MFGKEPRLMSVLRSAVLMLSLIAMTQTPAHPDSSQLPQGLVDRAYTVLTIKPSDTDPGLTAADLPHVVIYDRAAPPANILLFLTGTGGGPPGPLRFLNRAVERGYRVINLSYVDTPAVAQVCVGATLRSSPDCAKQFREKRAYGDGDTMVFDDAPQDAIVNRFAKLLQYLVTNDQRGQWNQYLDGRSPIWSRIAVAGQSQGGGMAEYIGQRQLVARVIAFSGGWDHSGPGKIAGWYFGKSATPHDRWYGTYNVLEPNAMTIAQTYSALGIPAEQTFALKLPVRSGALAHSEGVANPAYASVWDQLLGNGNG
jgi:hypothetical protein